MNDPLEFVYQARPSRVVFGEGSIRQVDREVDALGASRVLLVSATHDAAASADLRRLLGPRMVATFDRVVMHVPIDAAHEAVAEATDSRADLVLAFGGGSAIGLAKAIALETGLPILAVPTTYAGSEMTPIYGLTGPEGKRTGSDARVLPRTVVYDPELTTRMPAALAVSSGFNALAHAAEGLYAKETNPVTSLMAEEGIRAFAASLPRVVADAADGAARREALYAAWLCGTVLGQVGMALHHQLCHVLGGSFGLQHAQTHAVVLPHVLAFNASAAPAAMARIARALGAEQAAPGLLALAYRTDAPRSLRDLGLRDADVPRVAEAVVSRPYWNPRPVDGPSIRALLERALDAAPLSG